MSEDTIPSQPVAHAGGLTSRLRRLSPSAPPPSVLPEVDGIPSSTSPYSRIPQVSVSSVVPQPGFVPGAPAVPGSRFARQSAPVLPASWQSWGLPDLDNPECLVAFGNALPTNLPAGNGWVAGECIRCHRSNKVDPTLLLHPEGRFFCIECGWQGDARNSPSRHVAQWIEGFGQFLSAVIVPAAEAPHSFPFPAPLPHQANLSWAPAWNPFVNQWEMAWCLMGLDPTAKLRAAWVGLVSDDKENITWFRPRPVPVYPMGTAAAFLPLDHVEPVATSPSSSTARTIIVTSRVEDFLCLMASGLDRVVCLPPDLDPALPTAPPWQFAEIWDKDKCLLDTDEIILAIPSSSRSLEEELGRRLSRDRCSRVRYGLASSAPLDDLAEMSEIANNATSVFQDMGAEILVEMVGCAHPFPVMGIHELDDMDDAFEDLYRHGLQPGRSTGFPSMDPLYTVQPGQWTLVTGIPGHGKSTWVDGVMINLARRDGWRFGIFSPENQPPERHFAGLMEKLLNKPFSEGPDERITPAEKNSAKRWLNDRFKIILPDEEQGEWTLDAILLLAKVAVRRYGIQGLVIDPWNEIDHSMSGDKEVSYLSQSLTKIRRFARLHGVHVWIVAHPTKMQKGGDGFYPVPTPYDVSGGAQWRNKADNCVTVYRFVGQLDQDIADIHVQKIRFKEIGHVGIAHLRLNSRTNSWVDDVNYDLRDHNLQKGLRERSDSQLLPNPRRSTSLASPALACASDLL